MSERPSSSTSSSGHVDGLGRRSLAFDRTTGAILERVVVRPELAVFEHVLRRRVAHLASLEDERFARPSAVERDQATGELIVVAEFVTGSRVSELLETAADAAIVPGVDVALGYLLESVPALSVLHTVHRVTHGLIDPTRTVITAEGQVVFLDVAFGTPIERLELAPARLWSQFGVAALPTSSGPVRFNAPADIAQVALSALMLILGRNIRTQEFPDALPSLLLEVIDVAQIRGSAAFASGLQRFFERALPLPGRRPYATADDAVADVRQLVLRDIGVDTCSKAVIDFVENMDAAYAAAPASSEGDVQPVDTPRIDPPRPKKATTPPAPPVAATPVVAPPAPSISSDDDDEGEELELSLDNLDGLAEPEPEKPAVEEIYELSPLDSGDYDIAGVLESPFEGGAARLAKPVETTTDFAYDVIESALPSIDLPVASEPEPPIEPAVAIEVAAPIEPAPVEVAAPVAPEPVASTPEPIAEPALASTSIEPHAAEPALMTAVDTPASPAPDQPVVSSAESSVEPPVASAEEQSVEPATESSEESSVEPPVVSSGESLVEPDRESASSRRKKRQQQRSARARKDKLRSTTAGSKPMPVPEPPPPARPASPTGWLVSPQRSASFEATAAEQAPQVRSAPLPSVPSFTPSPVGHVPQPVYTPSIGATPAYGTPMAALQPPAPSPLTRPQTPPQPAPQTHVKIKANPPTPVRMAHIAESPLPSVERPTPPDRLGTLAPLGLGLNHTSDENEQPRAFPWKLAAIAVLAAVLAIVVGRQYLPGSAPATEEPSTQAQAPAPAPAAPPVDESTPDTPIPSSRGRLILQTQPAGIRVLVDRKPAGETPLTLDLPPGRRTLTFVTTGGEVNRAVRIVAGKATTLEIPVFSGWLSIVAPFVLDVAENGQRIATTEQNRITLPPGQHVLTLSNRDLGYTSVQDVEIEPGGVKSLTVDPRGAVSLNAQPWAEVWLGGQKLGDTPLVTQVALGSHEFVFKHPQHGERRLSATVRATGTSPLSVDFTK